MTQEITIKVADLIGSPLCIATEDGDKVFEILKSLLQEGQSVVISFEKVTMVISLFLNVAIGQLYGSFNEEEIRAKVQVEGLSGDDMELLKQVVDNAKRYYANLSSYDAAWRDVGEGDE
ncbi:MAG: STAS-like domain-containing protein [Candidatus Hydrogenedens sp.]|jgi:transcriptional regulator|nr:STAS-like domain-containing protein [Candidatus Hydrogenedens sp.]